MSIPHITRAAYSRPSDLEYLAERKERHNILLDLSYKIHTSTYKPLTQDLTQKSTVTTQVQHKQLSVKIINNYANTSEWWQFLKGDGKLFFSTPGQSFEKPADDTSGSRRSDHRPTESPPQSYQKAKACEWDLHRTILYKLVFCAIEKHFLQANILVPLRKPYKHISL